MRAVLSTSRPCKLQRGELRRVPQERRPGNLVGYYVCCPRCGFVSHCVGSSELAVSEGEAPGDVTMRGALKCVYCCVGIELERGEFLLTEGPDVRPVRYR
jgi:hypothetical protein